MAKQNLIISTEVYDFVCTCLVFFDGANLGGGIRSASNREEAAVRFCAEPARLPPPVVKLAFMLESSECFFSLLPK